MSFAQVIGPLIRVFVLTMTFALGLHANWQDTTYLVHKQTLLVRSLLATYVLTPLIAAVLDLAFVAPPVVEVGLFLLALSSGAPTLPKRLIQLHVDTRYAFSLAVIMALLAVVTVPLTLTVLRPFLSRVAMVSPMDLASVIAKGFLVPLLAGIAVRSFWPRFAESVRSPLLTASGIVLLGLVLLILAVNHSVLAGIGLHGFLIIVLLTCGAVAVGHVMGGPDPDDRTTLALACAIRSPALMLLIASRNFPNAKPLPIVAGYLLVSNLIVIPYLRWRKNRSPAVGNSP
jgi:BASS family bile acid:Na+ symporter